MGDISRNFKIEEFSCRCGCGFDKPDSRLVAALQILRDNLGLPIHILSGCRCRKHNEEVGGAANSMHLHGMAADIQVAGLTPEKVKQEALKIPVFKNGGIGIYNDFVHLDVRGYMARWDERRV